MSGLRRSDLREALINQNQLVEISALHPLLYINSDLRQVVSTLLVG